MSNIIICPIFEINHYLIICFIISLFTNSNDYKNMLYNFYFPSK